jgi:hypothetical protein
MKSWFRHYIGAARDPKFMRVAMRSGETLERVIFVWDMLGESAAEVDRGGAYRVDAADIAYLLRCETGSIAAILAEFEAPDVRLTGSGIITKWVDRQGESAPVAAAELETCAGAGAAPATLRSRAYRERKRRRRGLGDSGDPELALQAAAHAPDTGAGEDDATLHATLATRATIARVIEEHRESSGAALHATLDATPATPKTLHATPEALHPVASALPPSPKKEFSPRTPLIEKTTPSPDPAGGAHARETPRNPSFEAECRRRVGQEPVVLAHDFHEITALLALGVTKEDVFAGIDNAMRRQNFRPYCWANLAGWARRAAKDRLAGAEKRVGDPFARAGPPRALRTNSFLAAAIRDQENAERSRGFDARAS